MGVRLSGNQNFSPRICDSQAILPLDLYLYRLMTWPPFGNCVMKALHNFIAWSFLFEIVMRFSSPSLLKKIDDLGKMVTFLEKSLQKCTRKKPMILCKKYANFYPHKQGNNHSCSGWLDWSLSLFEISFWRVQWMTMRKR